MARYLYSNYIFTTACMYIIVTRHMRSAKLLHICTFITKTCSISISPRTLWTLYNIAFNFFFEAYGPYFVVKTHIVFILYVPYIYKQRSWSWYTYSLLYYIDFKCRYMYYMYMYIIDSLLIYRQIYRYIDKKISLNRYNFLKKVYRVKKWSQYFLWI